MDADGHICDSAGIRSYMGEQMYIEQYQLLVEHSLYVDELIETSWVSVLTTAL